MPLTTVGLLSSALCSACGACLPLKTAILLSEAASGAVEGRVPLTTAGLISGTVVRTGGWPPLFTAILLAGGCSTADGTWITGSVGLLSGRVNCCTGAGCESLSTLVVVPGGGCGAKGAAAPRSAVALTDGVCRPTRSDTGAFSRPPSSHAHRAIAQNPIVASKVAAITALRRPIIGG